MSKLGRMAGCHPDRQYYAKNLCEVCFKFKYPPEPKLKKVRKGERKKRGKASCHPEQPHSAKGLCKACYRKQYKRNNILKLQKKRKEYYELNKQKCYEALIEYRTRTKKSWKRTHKQLMLQRTRSRAKARGLEFNLSGHDFTIPDVCPVLGIPLKTQKGRPFDCSPSLDRIDNTKGYVKGNVIVVSHRANILKGVGTPEEHRKIADFYSALQ